MRRASSSGWTRSARSRARSSSMRAAGMTPVGRLGRSVFISREPLARAARAGRPSSWKRRCLKNEPFTQPTSDFDGSLLPRLVGPADLGREADLEGGVGEDGIPLGDLAILLPLERHGLGPIEHGTQRHPAEGDEVIGQRADQRLGRLIGHQGDLDPARPLQPRGEEVDALRCCRRRSATSTCPKSCCENSPGQALEAHLHRHLARAQRGDQLVERALAAAVAREPRPAQDLHRQQRRLRREHVGDQLPIGLGRAGTSDRDGGDTTTSSSVTGASRATRRTVRSLTPTKRATSTCAVAGGHQHLDRVAFEQREHRHLQEWR